MSNFASKIELDVKGTVTIRHFRGDVETGTLISEETKDNLVVLSGKSYIASRLLNALNASYGTDLYQIEIGSGVTAPSLSDTALGSSLGSATFASAPTISGNTVTFTANFPAGTGTGAVTEAGIFNNDSTPKMFNRVVFPVKNKGSNDSIQIVWAITIV